MFDFASLLPEAALSIIAQSAVRTPGRFYYSADTVPLVPELPSKETTNAVIGMIILGALPTLTDGDTLKSTYTKLTKGDKDVGTWEVHVLREDLPDPGVSVPRAIARLEGDALRAVLSEGINACSRAYVVDSTSKLAGMTKTIGGVETDCLGLGLMHACCNMAGTPDIGFTTTGFVNGAIAGQKDMARLTLTFTRIG